MAWEQPGFVITLQAAANLTTKQFHFVVLDSSGYAAAATSIAQYPIGVLQNKPTTGQEASVMVHGVTKAVADAAVAINAKVGASADGQAVTEATDNTSFVQGIALSAASNAGEMISVLINCGLPSKFNNT